MSPLLKIAAVLLLPLCTAAVAADEVQVSVVQGRLRGHRLTSRKGREFVAFQGIPFAKPPVGYLRFQKPQPADSWDGVRDATTEAPVCLQRNIYLRHEHVLGQEDCLYLNVYSPQLPDSNAHPLLDVMVWIHGGGWTSGSGNRKYYGPDFLMDKNIILVTINYRLGPLGFLSTGDTVCPGNNGLKDQVAALKWVKVNIMAFGGNPNSVTIFGESAGGASVHYHMMSPMSRGLFHKAISQSGTALCPWARPRKTVHHTHTLAHHLGCHSANTSELIACLKEKEGTAIIECDRLFMEWDVDPHIPFRPTVEMDADTVAAGEAFIVAEPAVLLRRSEYALHIPWINGITSEDGALKASAIYNDSSLVTDLNDRYDHVAPISMFWGQTSPNVDRVNALTREYYFHNQLIDENTVHQVVKLYTDSLFLHCAHEATKLQAASSMAPIYYYLFAYRGTSSFSSLFGDPTRNYGVCHADELQYLFPLNNAFPAAKRSENDLKMIEILTTFWANFAQTGNPTPGGSDAYPHVWQPTSSSGKEYLHIDSWVTMRSELLSERASFWDSLPIYSDEWQEPRDEL